MVRKVFFDGLHLVFRAIKNSSVFRLCQGSGKKSLDILHVQYLQLIILCCIMLRNQMQFPCSKCISNWQAWRVVKLNPYFIIISDVNTVLPFILLLTISNRFQGSWKLFPLDLIAEFFVLFFIFPSDLWVKDYEWDGEIKFIENRRSKALNLTGFLKYYGKGLNRCNIEVYSIRSRLTNWTSRQQNLDCCENLSVLRDKNIPRRKICQGR